MSVSRRLCFWFLVPRSDEGFLLPCSLAVKSAALMPRPSRAVIQTSKLLEYNSCPEFALAGSSTAYRRDYLFISLRTGHDSVQSAGDLERLDI